MSSVQYRQKEKKISPILLTACGAGKFLATGVVAGRYRIETRRSRLVWRQEHGERRGTTRAGNHAGREQSARGARQGMARQLTKMVTTVEFSVVQKLPH